MKFATSAVVAAAVVASFLGTAAAANLRGAATDQRSLREAQQQEHARALAAGDGKNTFDLGPQVAGITEFKCKTPENYIVEVDGTADMFLRSITKIHCMPSGYWQDVNVGDDSAGSDFAITQPGGFRSFMGGYDTTGKHPSQVAFYQSRSFTAQAPPTLGTSLQDGFRLTPWLCDDGTVLTGLRLEEGQGGITGFGTICSKAATH